MDTPSPPAVPDPVATANAQTKSNQETASYQAGLNNVNQVTPYGNLTYTKNPGSSQQVWHAGTDPDGSTSPNGTNGTDGYWETVPGSGPDTYTATTTFSPEQQKLYDLYTANQTQLGTIGGQQLQKAGDILNTPFDLNAATNAQYKDYTTTLLDPTWNARQSALEAQLNNKGIRPGQEAYTNAMRDFNSQRDTAYTSMQLQGQQQAEQQALAQRNQPLNEISALMSGSQVTQPNFVSTPQTSVSPTDVIGATQLSSQVAQNNYNQSLASNNAMMGGLFGVASAGLGGWMRSDRRMKTDIRQIGSTFKGTPIYAYRWMDEPVTQIGFMAQEIEKLVPDAVLDIGGVKHVNYELALEAV